jgi:hypothetical protein
MMYLLVINIRNHLYLENHLAVFMLYLGVGDNTQKGKKCMYISAGMIWFWEDYACLNFESNSSGQQ